VGAQFRLPAVHASLEELTAFLTRLDLPLWGADAGGEPVDRVKPPRRLALAVGNEGAGLRESIRAASDKIVGLPMAGEVESLNVSVAAGIMLWALRA
jgi:tRNA G18 (ribose-2'-O)-methylase SpoU